MSIKPEDAAVSVAENAGKPNSEITLSTGIKLKVRAVPTTIYGEIMRKYTRPIPPVIFIEDKGRKEENLNDPRFLQLSSEYDNNVSMAVIDAMILLGTEVSSVPASMTKPEDEAWADELEAIGIVIGENKRKRYLMWIKYVAATGINDITKIMEAVGRLTGVTEEDVQDAVSRFRRES
jgi:hypothetical protein